MEIRVTTLSPAKRAHNGMNDRFDSYRGLFAICYRFQALLPIYKVAPLGGSPRNELPSIADTIFYRFRTSCQWKAIPTCFAPGSMAHANFDEWVRIGFFSTLRDIVLELYHGLAGLNWRWQNMDAAMTKAQPWVEKSGKTKQSAERWEPSDRSFPRLRYSDWLCRGRIHRT